MISKRSVSYRVTLAVQSGAGKLLQYVNSVRHLAAIRDAVWDTMMQVNVTR